MNELDLIRLLTQLLPFYKPTTQWHVDIELVPVVKSSSSRDKARNTYFVRIASLNLSFRPREGTAKDTNCFSPVYYTLSLEVMKLKLILRYESA